MGLQEADAADAGFGARVKKAIFWRSGSQIISQILSWVVTLAVIRLLDIKQRVSNLIGELERRGSYVHIPRTDRDYAISVGLRMLTLRHLVLEDDGNYRVNPKELMLLKYYANAIAHLFDEVANAAE